MLGRTTAVLRPGATIVYVVNRKEMGRVKAPKRSLCEAAGHVEEGGGAKVSQILTNT